MSATLTSIWLSFACWWLAILFKDRNRLASAWLSGAGLLLLWTHIWLAYQVDHAGSQLAALQHTGEVLSQRGVGFVDPAIALGVNWIFAGCWSLDLLLGYLTGKGAASDACPRKPSDKNRAPLERVLKLGARHIWQWFFFWLAMFIWFNATVIFANTSFRWLALLLFVGIALQLSAAYIKGSGIVRD